MTATCRSYLEATARARIHGVVDANSFVELQGPAERVRSPHLAALELSRAFDDGVSVGEASLDGKAILIGAQEGRFMGGAVGEVHGAKLTGLLKRALTRHPAAVVLLLESGGVRLHEANAGLIAVSEILRAVLAARAAGISVIAVVGGAYGCFGGAGVVACCCDTVIASEEARLGLSGPEVIETAHGVEEFDSRDRALVWRTTGAKHRYLLGDVDVLVRDDMACFREAILGALARSTPLTVERLEARHQQLAQRLADFGEAADALEVWGRLGVAHPTSLPALEMEEFLCATAVYCRARAGTGRENASA
jgi:malonate decarboxylase beta subunit